jgi:hypothetical protein
MTGSTGHNGTVLVRERDEVEAPSGRFAFGTGSSPEATAGDLAELQAIIDSIQSNPRRSGRPMQPGTGGA